MSHFAETVESLRREHSLSFFELGLRTQLEPSELLQLFEGDKEPTLMQAHAIAKAFNVPLQCLTGELNYMSDTLVFYRRFRIIERLSSPHKNLILRMAKALWKAEA